MEICEKLISHHITYKDIGIYMNVCICKMLCNKMFFFHEKQNVLSHICVQVYVKGFCAILYKWY